MKIERLSENANTNTRRLKAVESVVVLGLSHKEAAERSGLTTGSVGALMQDERVQRYIDKLHAETERQHKVTREDVIQGLLDARERAELLSEPATEIRAWEAIAKMQGLNAPERHIYDLPEETKKMIHTLQNMDDEQVAKLAGVDGLIELGPGDYEEVHDDAG